VLIQWNYNQLLRKPIKWNVSAKILKENASNGYVAIFQHPLSAMIVQVSFLKNQPHKKHRFNLNKMQHPVKFPLFCIEKQENID
jgi:hypothetical protein